MRLLELLRKLGQMLLHSKLETGLVAILKEILARSAFSVNQEMAMFAPNSKDFTILISEAIRHISS